jgi:plasmid stabilization system protein ParE
MAEVRWTPQALDDLEAICLFIARDSPAMALIFAQRAFAATYRLPDFPERQGTNYVQEVSRLRRTDRDRWIVGSRHD